MKLRTTILSALALAAAALPVRADEVTDNLDSAKTAYEASNFSEAIANLDYASQLIRQKKGEAVAKLLPAAPSGWTAEEAENESQSASMMGGMVTAKRTYRRGDSRVTIQIQSDSPLLQSMAMMFSNPMMMTASGAKVETFKGQKCAVTYKASSKSGDIKAVVDNRYIVDINGDEVTREELTTFAKAMDFTKLASLK